MHQIFCQELGLADDQNRSRPCLHGALQNNIHEKL